MPVHFATSRSIRGPRHLEGRLEVIDDVGISQDDHDHLLSVFTLPAHVVSMDAMATQLWKLIQTHVADVEHALFVCPGNGAWLVEQALSRVDVRFNQKIGVDISRGTSSEIEITGSPHHIVVIEDVVETGNTAHDLATQLAHARCPVTFATTLWHDRDSKREHVHTAFGRFAQVLVAEHVVSDNEHDDVRSLSTLARKADMVKNQRYSKQREAAFLACMRDFMHRFTMLKELGVSKGYRIDPDSNPPKPIAS